MLTHTKAAKAVGPMDTCARALERNSQPATNTMYGVVWLYRTCSSLVPRVELSRKIERVFLCVVCGVDTMLLSESTA